jgi:hypothetical protein
MINLYRGRLGHEAARMKALALVVLACLGWESSCLAGAAKLSAIDGLVIRADWQDPALVPPRFRNHCGFDRFSGRPYCANHCGHGYEFYFCSDASFGCCHVGRGYCAWSGTLRCSP